MAVISRFSPPFILLTLNFFTFIRSSIIASPPALNLSNLLYPKVSTITESTVSSSPTHFLKGVLEAIAAKEKWESEGIHVSQIDANKAKSRLVQLYEFRIRVGKTVILVKMNEEISEWKRLVSGGENRPLEFEDFLTENRSNVVIDRFTVTGPFDLIASVDKDLLSLTLPLDKTYTGLRKISIGEGITVDVKGADEIATFYASEHHNTAHNFSPYMKLGHKHSVWQGVCETLPSVRIHGTASIVAYRALRPSAPIRTVFSSRNAIRLLPEKCFVRSRPHLSSYINEIPLLERLLRSFMTQRIGNFTAAISSVKMTTTALPIFRFPLELDRRIKSNDRQWSTLDEWRTKPMRERAWFEVVARIEEGILKPIFFRRVRPLMDAVSYSWSSLLSNVSFTKFPSLMVAPDPMTLDVKW